ncbi:MAG: thioredoxin domain-containing protein [Candidatus Binatia bacterium]
MAARRSALATLVLAAVGFAVAGWIAHSHAQLDSGLTPGCRINAGLDCAPVLTSEYAYVLGVPVAWWAMATYAAIAAAALLALRVRGTAQRRRLASALFGAAIAVVAFSAYLAYIAFGVLGAVCPQCTVLDVINLALLATTARLYSAAQSAARDQHAWGARARVIGGGVLAAAALLLATVVWHAATDVAALSADEVCEQDPEFCRVYEQLPVVAVDVPGGHVKGDGSARVTIVEFSDFECGHCQQAYRNLKAIWPRYRDDVQVRFHHFPLDGTCNPSIPAGGGHRYACLAAMAAECAGQQGRFWEYHDQLFDNQPNFDRDRLLGYADAVGLDRAKFGACLDSDAPRAAVQRDVAAGQQLGIESTPTLFFNGRAVRGAPRTEQFGYAIVLERAAKSKREG